MAKRIKNDPKSDAVYTMLGDDMGDNNSSRTTNIAIIGRGKGKYLWVGGDKYFTAVFTGDKTLKRFAKEILKGLK